MFTQKALVFLHIVLHSTSQKAGNTDQVTYQHPFHCNFGFTCKVSAHVQTLLPGYNETDLCVQYMGNYLDNRVSVPALVMIVLFVYQLHFCGRPYDYFP